MFDTMTFTKVLGALCGSLLVFLLGGWAAETLYHTGGAQGERQAYVIDTGEDEMVAEVEEEQVAFSVVYASASPAAGERLWNQCRACHQLEDGVNGVGPHLYASVGREIASADGFSYSDALTGLDGTWTPEELDGFLLNPRQYAPGTIMGYAGMRDAKDRANLIAYLSTIGGEFAPPEADQASAGETDAPAGEDAARADSGEPAAVSDSADESAGDAAATGEAADDRFAAADVAAGEAAYRQCRACHQVADGVNGVGPHLYGVVGREIAAVADYNYTPALAALAGVWTPEEIEAFLADPRGYAPGNKMTFPGVRDEQTRIDLIGYLATTGN